ncbi:hypothetical protein DCMF_23560 [Candidatus Formimonas warabiya]|uniref:Uncharacterized protein n=1 Tax=Formimonas warabiya TaxID=1761012 RepID=A0A3G1KY40_FORW1|nr:hypothetical protein DCMF_23560 [Candidatus Formimonas warabiya]
MAYFKKYYPVFGVRTPVASYRKKLSESCCKKKSSCGLRQLDFLMYKCSLLLFSRFPESPFGLRKFLNYQL